MKKSLFLLFLITTCINLYAQPGTLDPSFGTGGITLFHVPNTINTNFTNGALQTDGKIIAAGWVERSSSSGGNSIDFVVARFLPTGFPDPGFGSGGYTITDFGNNDFAYSVVIQQDGKIVLGGRSDASGAFTAHCLARYNADGSPDASFGNGGKITGQFTYFGDQINSLSLQADGKIIAAGHLIVDNIFYGFVLRLKSDGSTDGSFGDDGRVTMPVTGLASSVIVQPDSRILLSAQVNTTNGEIRYNTTGLIRFNNDGSLDNSFGNNGIVVVDPPAITGTSHDIALQADNRIVVAGWSDDSKIYIARFYPDGSPDPTFGTGGVVLTPFEGGYIYANSILLQENGKILAGGSTFIQNQSDYELTIVATVLLRYNPDGSLDNSFGQGGKIVTNLDQPDNKQTSGGISKLLLTKNRVYAIGHAFIYDYFNSIYDFQAFYSGVVASYKLEEPAGISLSCPASIVVATDADKCNAIVNNIDPDLNGGNAPTNFVLSGATTGSGGGSASGTVFNNGITTVTYSMTDDPSKNCSFSVTVNDLQPPVITNLAVSPSTLWPPNHKMQTVTLTYKNQHNCDVNACQVSVSSNHPANNNGDGNSAPDWEIINDHQVRLRAETSVGNTRRYTITVICKDAAGNPSLPTITTVVVANNKGADMGSAVTDRLMVTTAPNPSSSAFTLAIKGNKNGEKISVRIWDNLGRLAEQKSSIGVNQNIRVGAALNAGVYLAEVVQGNNKVTLKLIKYSE